MLVEKMNLENNFRRKIFLVIITIFGVFLVIPILENTYAENDLVDDDIEIPFYYFYNYSKLLSLPCATAHLFCCPFILNFWP